MATCPRGHIVTGGKRFCGDCGADMLGQVSTQHRAAPTRASAASRPRSTVPARPRPPRWKGLRPLSWIIIVFNVLMVVWLIVGIASTADNCDGEQFVDACEAGTAVGAGLGIVMILFFTAIVDVILGVIWMVTNRDR